MEAGLFAAHALHDTTIAPATIERLQRRRRSHTDRDAAIWLGGIAHACADRVIADTLPSNAARAVPAMERPICAFFTGSTRTTVRCPEPVVWT